MNPGIACLASQSSDWLDALWASLSGVQSSMTFVRLNVIGCCWGGTFNCPASTHWLINLCSGTNVKRQCMVMRLLGHWGEYAQCASGVTGPKDTFSLAKCDIGMVLYVEEWEYISFHFHCHNLCLPGQVLVQKCHLVWSQSDQIILLLMYFLTAEKRCYTRRLCTLIQWHYWGFEDQGLPSKIVVLQMPCSIWSIL